MEVVASAPAKVILFGEHFVVYGEPAIVLAIDKRIYAKSKRREDKQLHVDSLNLNLSGYFVDDTFKIEQGNSKTAKLKFEPIKLAVEKVSEKYGEQVGLDIEINSTVPIAAGLGSSASVAAATTASVATLLGVNLSKEELFRITFEAEKIVHGSPSGVDPAISTFGGILHFQMDTGFKPLEVEADIPLVIGDTGVERSTRAQIEKVRDARERYPQIMRLINETAREVVLRAVDALKENDLETLGELMNINQALLYGVGVSDESLEWLINSALRAGALGAKLTGAGGGGCMIALAKNERLPNISEAVQKAGGRPFIARRTDEGVRIEPT